MSQRTSLIVSWAVTSWLVATTCSADIITQWNFNSAVPDGLTTTGSTIPNVGAGTASLVGGTTATFASGGGSTDPGVDDTGWNTTTYATQGTGNKSRGVQFAVSTRGYKDITISWDQRHSNTSSRFVQFQYSLDGGSTFTDHTLFTHIGGGTWFNNQTVDLTSIAGANFNAQFAFRIVAAFDPAAGLYAASLPESTATLYTDYATSGTWRFDMVTVHGTVPEPGTLALLGTGFAAMIGLGVVRARRRSFAGPSA